LASPRNLLRNSFWPLDMGKLRHITKWLKGWLPGCYCHTCGQCSHYAIYRFPGRYHNSCEACLTCPSSEHHLWKPHETPAFVGAGASGYFRMSAWYRARYWAECFIGYLNHKYVGPKDENYPVDGQGPVQAEMVGEAKQ
jgi:hypothetical protein